jgi:hypothetical protein
VYGRVLTAGCSAYGTIQDAIDDAANGDTVEVCAGTWFEGLELDGKALTVRATGGAAATTIDAEGWRTVARVWGGADVTFEGFTFANGAGSTGGNLSCQDSRLVLRDSVVRDGEAGSGGGLGAVWCTGLVERTTFHDNLATWSGGAVYVQGDEPALVADTFQHNEADSDGGAVYVDGNAEVADNTFEGNHATRGGGAWIQEGWGDVRGNTLFGNTSEDDGAAVYVFGGAPAVTGNTFTANDSGDEGGALRVKLSAAAVRDNDFVDNHADYRGGAMKISHAASELSGNTYEGNTTWVTGGAVLLYESASTLRGETFVGNTASADGGALAILAGWGPVLLEDCRFEGNHASDNGGHLYVDVPGQTVTIRRGTFDDGTADRGAAVYAVDTRVDLENSLLTHNAASVSGAGLSYTRVTGSVLNSVFMWNTAPEGSASTFADSPTVSVRNTVFRLSTTGRAIRVDAGAAPAFRYDDFSGNSGNFSGMASVLGTNGNLAVAPAFTNAAGGNFTLQPTSGLRNTGDPGIFDLDSSRSDLGVFGGPRSW